MSQLSHFDSEGIPHIVDVGEKQPTERTAIAAGSIAMKAETLQMILDSRVSKGDVLEVARLAGIMATKRTSDLIPLCHPIAISSVELKVEPNSGQNEQSVEVTSTVKAVDRTGVEMEALVSVSTALLTIYDMCKSVDRGMTISQIQLRHKSGGKSGTFDRDSDRTEKGTSS